MAESVFIGRPPSVEIGRRHDQEDKVGSDGDAPESFPENLPRGAVIATEFTRATAMGDDLTCDRGRRPRLTATLEADNPAAASPVVDGTAGRYELLDLGTTVSTVSVFLVA